MKTCNHLAKPSRLNKNRPSYYAPAIVVQSDLTVVSDAKVDFDQDFGAKYKVKKGVLLNEDEGEVFAPVAMWLEALDLVLQRLQDKKTPLSRVRGISGSCQQHGSVYWSREAEGLLRGVVPGKALVDQLTGAFSHPFAPNWQDHSTQQECDRFDAELGSAARLAEVTGSAAHHVRNFHGVPTYLALARRERVMADRMNPPRSDSPARK